MCEHRAVLSWHVGYSAVVAQEHSCCCHYILLTMQCFYLTLYRFSVTLWILSKSISRLMAWLWSAWSLPSSRNTSWISLAWEHWNHYSPWFTKESEMSFSTISNTLTFQWRYANVLRSNMHSCQCYICKSVLTLRFEVVGCSGTLTTFLGSQFLKTSYIIVGNWQKNTYLLEVWVVEVLNESTGKMQSYG